MHRFRYTIELSPPKNLDQIEAYYKKFKHLFRYTNSFSISSHATATSDGFDRSLRLARFLLDREPSVSILYHITCSDLNRDNISERLALLRESGIRRLLVVTGEGYAARLDDDRSTPNSQFCDSSQLLHHMKQQSQGDWFESIAIAGYPSVQNAESECDRLLKKSTEGLVDSVYTQCLFSVSELDHFFELAQKKLTPHDIRIVPSIALFDSIKSLRKSSRLTKVNPNPSLLFHLGALEEEDSPRFSQRYLELICRKLAGMLEATGDPRLEINICSFGLFEFASTLMGTLERSS